MKAWLQHKHLIEAAANGCTIQYKDDAGKWVDVDHLPTLYFDQPQKAQDE